jgi:hypothetical protein
MTTTPIVSNSESDVSGELAIYRREALMHRGRLAEDGAALLEAPPWVSRLFWCLTAGVVALAALGGGLALGAR